MISKNQDFNNFSNNELPLFEAHPGSFNLEEAKCAAYNFLVAIGEDPSREGLAQTPDRIARASREIFASLCSSKENPYGEDGKDSDSAQYGEETFNVTEEEFINSRDEMEIANILSAQFTVKAHGLICVRDIEFFSTCEHHLLPFYGTVDICYDPAPETVLGLSKLARLVQFFARRPQVQERLSAQIAHSLVKCAHNRGALVKIKAKHMCMSMRGASAINAYTATLGAEGSLADETSPQYTSALHLLEMDSTKF